ncbi:TIGR00730 family Rossman fold protein [Candidatus Kaiserbacteria bacterium]|nr:TIGR00730 family Rossman fold protein [Candidatus Kaiserbacteria bacterium]
MNLSQKKEGEALRCKINRKKFPQNSHDGEIAERVGRIASEFTQGFEVLQKYDLAATFFGSARCSLGSALYEDASKLAYRLSRTGFTIITGGAAGVMEAANKGAHDAGGDSVGLNITLPEEQSGNDYTTDRHDFHYFFTRKVMLTFASEVYIYFPGGFGTLDEFFEIATLIQTKKIEPIPIILIGEEYWRPLVKWIEEELLKKHKTVSKEDTRIYTLVDSVDEAYNEIVKQVCE